MNDILVDARYRIARMGRLHLGNWAVVFFFTGVAVVLVGLTGAVWGMPNPAIIWWKIAMTGAMIVAVGAMMAAVHYG